MELCSSMMSCDCSMISVLFYSDFTYSMFHSSFKLPPEIFLVVMSEREIIIELFA